MTARVPAWPDVFSTLLAREDLDAATTTWAFDQVMSGSATPSQLAGFLIALRAKGETVTEVRALADVLLAHAHRFTVLVPGHLSAEQETIVRHILADHRPAHTTFDLCTLAAGMRVGIGLHAGLTSTVGNSASFTPLQVGASVLGRGVVVGSPGPATIPGASRLGVDTRVA